MENNGWSAGQLSADNMSATKLSSESGATQLYALMLANTEVQNGNATGINGKTYTSAEIRSFATSIGINNLA